jgi:putative phosphoribosyl transferase
MNARVPVGRVTLDATLGVPTGPRGLVVFAHGSGSSRLSPRNRFVAEALNRRGIATVLADLLTEPEAESRGNVFDVELLAGRLREVARWGLAEVGGALPLGYFGASTGAAAALIAAVEDPPVAAVVSRGGRPDLAGAALAKVKAPTLLIVGGADEVVLELNRQALAALRCRKELAIVPGATHLFEEPGALEQVAELAGAWFAGTLQSGRETVPSSALTSA